MTAPRLLLERVIREQGLAIVLVVAVDSAILLVPVVLTDEDFGLASKDLQDSGGPELWVSRLLSRLRSCCSLCSGFRISSCTSVAGRRMDTRGSRGGNQGGTPISGRIPDFGKLDLAPTMRVVLAIDRAHSYRRFQTGLTVANERASEPTRAEWGLRGPRERACGGVRGAQPLGLSLDVFRG